ncbi:MAG: hypothetical protein NC418_02410 [Muribaculaceae bacterium]|nr:hypothetical protein [Muribaculaceae bacterium]
MKPLIRVTQIEAFRRYIEHDDSFGYPITEQSVIEAVCGGFKGNALTRIGTAFHSIVESGSPRPSPNQGKYDIPVEGHTATFSRKQVQIALDYRNEHPHAYHEVRLYKDYGPAIVTGCADIIDLLEVRDVKTKFSAAKDSDYTDSCQWRFYLDIFEADVFHFDLFCFEGYKSVRHGYDVSSLPLSRHLPPITCYRYPDMVKDCTRLLNAFLAWAETRNLMSYLIRESI